MLRVLCIWILLSVIWDVNAQKTKRIIPKKGDVALDKQSYYHLLDVENTATEKEIRKAYRKLALEFHPDKVQTDTEEEKKEVEQYFVKLANAYEILSDEVTRKRYDYLLSIGQYEYEFHRDWSDIDAKFGFAGPKKETKKTKVRRSIAKRERPI